MGDGEKKKKKKKNGGKEGECKRRVKMHLWERLSHK